MNKQATILITCGHCGKTYNPQTEDHTIFITNEQPNGKWYWCQWSKKNMTDA